MSKIVSNYPRKAEVLTAEQESALKASFSGLFWLLLWLPFGVWAWCGIVKILWWMMPLIKGAETTNLLLAVLMIVAGNLVLSKSIENAAIGLGYGRAGRPRLHLLVFFGNLLFLGLGGFVVLHLKLYNEIRSSKARFMSRRELVDSWSDDEIAPSSRMTYRQTEVSDQVNVRH